MTIRRRARYNPPHWYQGMDVLFWGRTLLVLMLSHQLVDVTSFTPPSPLLVTHRKAQQQSYSHSTPSSNSRQQHYPHSYQYRQSYSYGRVLSLYESNPVVKSSSSSSSTNPTVSSTPSPNPTASPTNPTYSLHDERAYPQQTPHSARHFLPSHPFYQPQSTIQPKQPKQPNSSSVRRRRRRIPKLVQSLTNRIQRPSRRTRNQRFMEGWYYRITLPTEKDGADADENGTEEKISFAFIFSIEDPGRQTGTTSSPPSTDADADADARQSLKCAAVQVMGPNDEYIIQADRDDTKFWANEFNQGFGCTFEWNDNEKDNADYDTFTSSAATTPALDPEVWKQQVKSGFQMLPTRLQGRVDGHDGTVGGVFTSEGSEPKQCEFDMTIEPLSGWGNDDLDVQDSSIKPSGESIATSPNTSQSRWDRFKRRLRPSRWLQKDGNQKSTAGWLASYAVFEPHWQVTLADARATGFATWNGKRYDFKDVPFYAEKNWGGEFPSKWYWAQCNSFDGYTSAQPSLGTDPSSTSSSSIKPRLSVTAGGGTRKLPFLFGKTEDLGMVSVHYNGIFYEAVPWTGTMEWETKWGHWWFLGRCTTGQDSQLFEVEMLATCDPEETPGVVLRAPTRDLGLAYFCKDSFCANVTLSLYQLVWDETTQDYVRGKAIVDRATSDQCAVEIGGGPWYDVWKGKSLMKQPMRGLVRLPYLLRRNNE